MPRPCEAVAVLVGLAINKFFLPPFSKIAEKKNATATNPYSFLYLKNYNFYQFNAAATARRKKSRV
jgi:hypothetical protein